MIKYWHLVLFSLNVLAISLLGNMLLKRSFRPRHKRSEKSFFTTQRSSAWSVLTGTIILSTVCRLLVGFTLVSELPKLLKKKFPTFRLLSPEMSECFSMTSQSQGWASHTWNIKVFWTKTGTCSSLWSLQLCTVKTFYQWANFY